MKHIKIVIVTGIMRVTTTAITIANKACNSTLTDKLLFANSLFALSGYRLAFGGLGSHRHEPRK